MTNRSLNTMVLFIERHREIFVHCCALFFLIAGLAYSYHLGDTLRFRDETQYLAIARNIVAGHGYSLDGVTPTAVFPPVWPLLLSLFLGFGAPVWLLRSLNFVALALCVYVIRSMLRLEKAGEGAPLSAMLLIVYCVLFYTAGTLYTQTLFTLVLLLILRLAISRQFGYGRAMLLGLLLALEILIHPTGVFVAPVVAIWLLFSPDRHMLRKVVLCALVALSLVSCWSFRNYLAFGRYIPLTSHGGDTLYIGNNPTTSLSAWYTYTREDYYKEANRLPESEQNRYYLRKTLEFWTGQPVAAAKLYLRKLLYYFAFRNNLLVKNRFGLLRSIVMFVTYYPLLLCLVFRLISAHRVPLSRTEKLLVAIYIGSAFFHAIFLPRIRFRLPYDVVLIAHIGIMYARFGPSLFGLPRNGRIPSGSGQANLSGKLTGDGAGTLSSHGLDKPQSPGLTGTSTPGALITSS